MQVGKWARWLHNPCRLGVPTASERGAESEVAHKWARWLHNPCPLRGPHRFKAGGKIRSGSGQQWKILFFGGHATNATSPYILGDPQHRGTKSEVAAPPLPSWGPKRGRKCYITPAFRGSPTEGDGNKSGSQKGGRATSPLRSWGSPKKGTKSKVAHKWAEVVLLFLEVLKPSKKNFFY